LTELTSKEAASMMTASFLSVASTSKIMAWGINGLKRSDKK
jgi:hypothetical protein